MASTFDGYVNVVDFGARPNSFLDDTEAFLRAIATGKSIFVSDGIFYVSKTLVIENQNLIGCGSLRTHIVSTATERDMPILRAGRSCKISDLLLKFAHIDGDESEGERVGIFMHGDLWPLQRASSITNVNIQNVGTCMYMPRKDFGRGPGPFNVEHANLELSNFTFRAIDYGARHRVGNIFNNIFVANHGITKPVDCIIRFDGDSCNVSMSHITLMSTCCRNAAISLNCVRGFHISTLHIENIGLTENGHGLIELNNSSGEFGSLGFSYLPLDCTETSLIKLYNAYYDLCLTEKELAVTNHWLRIGNLDVACVNDPIREKNYLDRSNDGLVDHYRNYFKFITRDAECEGIYSVAIDNISYYTFKDDKEVYEEFLCDDDNIMFLKKGFLPLGGPTSQRPQNRLCKYVTEYFDTDIGKKLCWNGEKWV